MFPAAGDGSGNSYCGFSVRTGKMGDLRVKLVSVASGPGVFRGSLARRASPDHTWGTTPTDINGHKAVGISVAISAALRRQKGAFTG